jgi:P27 family predicted phage terminase small subunit
MKKLAGNPGRRPLNAHEARIPASIPSCPPHLNREAKAEWKRIVQTLHDHGLLTDVDRAALAVYCQAYGRWVKAERDVTKHGMTEWTAHGTLTVSPYIRIAHQAMDRVHKLSVEFGLTPSSRSRVTPVDMDQPSLADFLFQKAKTER